MTEKVSPITYADLKRLEELCRVADLDDAHEYDFAVFQNALSINFPALRERLRLAEEENERLKAEATHHRLLREEAMEQCHSLKEELQAALYCLELNGTADTGVREKLADRDAKMKAEGAAEAWDIVAERIRLVGDESAEKYATGQAAALRERAR